MELIAVPLLLLAWGVTASHRWYLDVRTNLSDLSQGTSDDNMVATDRAIAIGDLLALAMLADEVLLPAERDALTRLLAEHAPQVTADEVIARFEARVRTMRAGRTLEAAVRATAARLSADDRARVLDMVKDLATHGAGIPVDRGYRAQMTADPDALVETFTRALAPAT